MDNATQETPLISVVMSVYNNIDYIEKAVASILAQSYEHFEFLIFDDGSTDGTRAKLQQYAQQDPRIKLTLNEENRGLLPNLNAGLEQASGEYIARMDGDDYSFPDRFKKQVHLLKTRAEIVLVGTGYFTIDNKDRRYKLTIEASEAWEVYWINLFRPVLMHPSAMFRTNLLTEHGLRYKDDMFPAEDFDMWSRMAAYGEIHVIQEPLIEYRLHDNNISATKFEAQMAKTAEIVTNNIQREFPDLAKHYARDLLGTMNVLFTHHYLTAKDFDSATRLFNALLDSVTKTKQLNVKSQQQLKQLAARWLLKGWLRSKKQKLAGALKLRSFYQPIGREVLQIIKRHMKNAHVE